MLKVKALLFDVFGTVVDWRTGIAREVKSIAKKNNISLRDVACNFVLLKRGGKKGRSCSIVEVSAGEKSIEKSLKMTRNMITSVKRGMNIKNRESCKFCPFNGTEYCT